LIEGVAVGAAIASKLYQAHEFARLSGVTVRTLHHYDRLGLLKPSGRTPAGYRLYSQRDLLRLEQIVALKLIGFPLKQIRELLQSDVSQMSATLRRQRETLAEKRRQLDAAMNAIENAERVVQDINDGSEPDWDVFRKIIEVIEMTNNMEWAKKYYTEEQLAALRARWSPELQAKAEQDWAQLLREVAEAIGRSESPASAHAQSLAERWQKLIDGFTGGDAATYQGLKNLYADEANWPRDFKQPFSNEACAFIAQAKAAKGV
jgi:MerR family transcriptional regulator, thiopeptide resistance regulator